MQTKTCKKCNKAKPLSEFYKCDRLRFGVMSVCKKCLKARRHEYEKRPEVIARRKELYKQNHSKELSYQDAIKRHNPAVHKYITEYYNQ